LGALRIMLPPLTQAPLERIITFIISC